MYPTTAIEILIVSIITIILFCLAFILKKPYKSIMWIIASIILISSIAFFSLRPFLIESHQNKAIEQLDTYLSEKYKNESWVITDTDESELQKTVKLHVIFESEPSIVYKYEIEETTIRQIRFGDLNTGIADDKLLETGIELQHLE